MITKIHISLLALLILSILFSVRQSLAITCNGVFYASPASVLTFQNIEGFEKNARYGKGVETTAPAEVNILISHVDSVLQKIAAIFSKDLKTMFVQKLNVNVTASEYGPLESHSGSIKVFPHWKPADGLPSEAIFAHELGHIIEKSPEKFGLPMVLGDLSSYNTFKEFFADWVSSKAVGKVGISGLSDVDEFARGEELLSYDHASGSFSKARTLRDLFEWLIKVSAKKVLTQEEAFLLKIFKVGQAPFQQKYEETKDLDKRNLLELENITELDSHQLGMPVFYFMRDLESRLKRPLVREFIAAIDLLDAKTETDQMFNAFLSGYEGFKEDFIKIVIKTPRHLFEEMRKGLSDEEKIIFDELYISRKIREGLRLDEVFIENIARTKAMEIMLERFQSNDFKGVGIYNPTNRYFDASYGMAGKADIKINRLK